MCIGYFQGTDPMLLTKLNLKGHGSLPLGNHWDGQGKLVSILKKGDVTAVVGYFHKVMPPFTADRPTAHDQLLPCKTLEIPVYLIIPSTSDEARAKELLGEAASFVTLVTPETVEEEIFKGYQY